MDLHAVTTVSRPRGREDLNGPLPGDAWLAGGTWLFSEPQPSVRRLIDLADLGWPALQAGESGLTLAATCTIAELSAFEAPPDWIAAPLIGECCRAFLASFKVWNTATIGGNLCLALPAGPMISLCAALEGVCTVWTPGGGERQVPALDFARGPLDNALQPGELLRAVDLPAEALRRRAAFRRASLTPLGRSGVLLIGMLARETGFRLTVTAATRRPVQLCFDQLPTAQVLAAEIAAMAHELYYDDVHGTPDWRRHMTALFAQDIRRELAGEP